MKVELYGEIVADEYAWLYELFEIPHCSPGVLREALGNMAADEELILEINSPGGDVWAGFEMYGLIRAHKGPTEARIIALAASAATTVSSACDRVLASPVAQLMIHQPSVYIDGAVNNDDAGRLQSFLDSVRASIINGYVIKAGGNRERFEELVDASTWMPAQDAIALGLVDGILDEDDEILAALAESGGLLVKNALGLGPELKDLMQRYEAAVLAGTMQAHPAHPVEPAAADDILDAAPAETARALAEDWRYQGALALARAR